MPALIVTIIMVIIPALVVMVLGTGALFTRFGLGNGKGDIDGYMVTMIHLPI